MFCLGMFVFALDTLSYQELQRRTNWKHASQPLVGARNASASALKQKLPWNSEPR